MRGGSVKLQNMRGEEGAVGVTGETGGPGLDHERNSLATRLRAVLFPTEPEPQEALGWEGRGSSGCRRVPREPATRGRSGEARREADAMVQGGGGA